MEFGTGVFDPLISWCCWWKKSCTSWYAEYPTIQKMFLTSQVVSRISSINSMSESLIKIQPVPVDPPQKNATSPSLVAIQALLLEILMLAAHHPERRCFWSSWGMKIYVQKSFNSKSFYRDGQQLSWNNSSMHVVCTSNSIKILHLSMYCLYCHIVASCLCPCQAELVWRV